ncbi:MAG: ATP synthase F0 subunit B [Myxococcota bacterium]|nr:ATP synthase F0 subunit B [Myxococcota bacterium]
MTSGLLLLASTAHAAGSMSLVPDWKLTLIQMAPYLASLAVLHFVLFKPMLAYLQGRDQATVGTREEAARLQQEAEARLQEYEQRLAAAKAEIQAYSADHRHAAAQEREELISKARAEAEAEKTKALESLRAEVELASRELDSLGRSLGEDITKSVLGPQPNA